jgi:ATP-dependent helicase/DNAse subunit B
LKRVKVFHAPLDSRVSTLSLFQEAKEYLEGKVSRFTGPFPHHDFSPILYLAPHSAKVKEGQEIFHALLARGGTVTSGKEAASRMCYIPPEMATLRAFAEKVYSLYGNRRILQESLVPLVLSRLSGKGIGFSILVWGLISDIKAHYPAREVSEIRDIFADTLKEMSIPESVAALPLEGIDLMNRYETFMESNGLVDRHGVLHACPGQVPLLERRVLIVDGYYDPDASERDVLRALMVNSDLALVSIPYDCRLPHITDRYIHFLREHFTVEEGGAEDSQAKPHASGPAPRIYCSYPDPEGEVEGIARNIKSLYVSGVSRELEKVVVAFPSLARYAPLVERVFTRYGIPFDLSGYRSTGKRRPFKDIIGLLSSVAEGYPRLKFAEALSSEYFRKIPGSLRQWMPLLSLQSGIIAGKESWLSIILEGSEVIDAEMIPRGDMEKDLKWVFKKLKPLEEIATSAPFSVCVDVLRKVMSDFGFLEPFPPDSGEDAGGEAFREEKEALHRALEQVSLLGALFPGDITLREFSEVLIHVLEATGREEEGQGVRVMDFFALMGLSPHFLYLGGLTDGAMPRRQDMDYFLPDSVKRKLGFSHFDRYIDIQRVIFSGISASAQHVSLSYPMMDGDTRYLPSSFLYPGEEKGGHIPGIFSMEEYLIRKGVSPLSSHLREIEMQSASFPPSYLKVTDIDAYRFCPRKFFIERVAGITPLEVKEYEVEAITLGNILHKIMEKIIPEPMEGLDTWKEKAVCVAQEVMEKKKISPYWKELIKDTFMEILPDIYERELEIRGEGYVPSELEKSIVGEPLKGIRLKGKIDRFDRMGDGVQIIDYKTGSAGLTCAQVAKGNENLQLFLYAAIMKSHGYRVDRVGIYSFRDLQIKWCPPGKRSKGGDRESMDSYVIACLKFLEEAVRGMRAGDFAARPLNEYNCSYCHEYSLCPYVQQ